jgi:hypothetical protein
MNESGCIDDWRASHLLTETCLWVRGWGQAAASEVRAGGAPSRLAPGERSFRRGPVRHRLHAHPAS